ncbi:MAG: DCC1-like thiol-disulfide oxidoreductase family protein [Methylococcales bacterium]|nr:DCC1-like thiol-disulfide oxidoreductase family protein [Methylococcales bacterium]
MYTSLVQHILQLSSKSAPATGIGLFRLLYGLVALQEIFFLLYFNHLIFDPIPYIDVEFPMIPFFLGVWAIIAFCLCIGYRSQFSALACYAFWIVFVQFTPMQRDFDGGFDLFMTGAGFFLLFMPIDKAFAVDGLRYKLQNPFKHYAQYSPASVSILAYYIPVTICLSFLYFDSAIHKMFAPHWRNGLGSWLPGTQPYYVSAINMSPLLNNEFLQKCVGYTILVFQFSFIFFVQQRYLRPVYFVVGLGLHLGIMLTLNIYPFGAGMLIFYVLLVPFSWWRGIAKKLKAAQPTLSIFYDEKCPLCNRTALILNHIDIFQCLDFKGVQTYARNYAELNAISDDDLLHDLYALDANGKVSFGVMAYSQILIHMRYLAGLGLLLRAPIIYPLAARQYRQIADNRARVPCDEKCIITGVTSSPSFYAQLFDTFKARPKFAAHKLAKVLVILLIFQLNSSIHYGILYRLNVDMHQNALRNTLDEISNTVLMVSQTFFGITPHALYLHDHFEGYDRILAITYHDAAGKEQWLPFVNEEGRLLAPNWGRVHSMWANIAVTPTINLERLSKFIMKVTAFFGKEVGLDINQTVFDIKMKKIHAPSVWVYDQLNQNLAGDWQTIGSAVWVGNKFSVSLPNNINDL